MIRCIKYLDLELKFGDGLKYVFYYSLMVYKYVLKSKIKIHHENGKKHSCTSYTEEHGCQYFCFLCGQYNALLDNRLRIRCS